MNIENHIKVFKRASKRRESRDIKYLHNLWIKASERRDNKWKDYCKVRDEVIKKIQEDEHGIRYIFKDSLSSLSIVVELETTNKGYSMSFVPFDQNNRDMVLSYLSRDEEIIELSNNFHMRYNMYNSDKMMSIAFKYFWRELEYIIEKETESYKEYIRGIFSVSIDNIIYDVERDYNNRWIYRGKQTKPIITI